MRIRDAMAPRFGKDSVFIDIDSIPLGVDFLEYINSQLSACDALIAIIGPHWIEAGRGPGQGVHLKTDFVRIEVEEALKRKVPVIPAFVAGARMPRPNELPKALRPIVSRNATAIDSGVNFRNDVNRLIRALDEIVPANKVQEKRTLVFVSLGGTCRDPMAKAITEKLFEEHKPSHHVVIRAAGLGGTTKTQASHAARLAVKEMYGEDLLANHKPQLLTERLAKEADLILIMDRSLLKRSKTALDGWPNAYQDKTYVLKEFFGLKGDVSDPWPDGKNEATLSRYRDCANELRQILTQNFDRLIKALGV